MALTPIFNAAANGDDGQMPADAGPSPRPDGGSPASVVEIPPDSATIPPESGLPPQTRHAFGNASAQPVPSSPSLAAERAGFDNRAALEALEQGRATPDLKHNLRPPRRLEQSVHADIEEWRERFITWLRAEIEAEPPDDEPEHEAAHDLGSDLEPSL